MIQQHSNINLTTPTYKFMYMVESSSRTYNIDYSNYRILVDGDVLEFVYDRDDQCKIHSNYWERVDYSKITMSSDILMTLPQNTTLRNFFIYIPTHSLESLKNDNRYAICIYTYINGRKIILGCASIDYTYFECIPPIKRWSNEYYQMVTIQVVDPFSICYGDDWDNFRRMICEEPNSLNNTGSLVSVSIDPIIPTSENGVFIKDPTINGGTCGLMLSQDVVDLSVHLQFDNNLLVEPTLKYSTIYNDTFTSLEEYLRETYQLYDYDSVIEVVVKDKDDVYKYNSIENPQESGTIDSIYFDSWDEYVDGMELSAIMTIKVDDEDVLYIKSNTIPITKELFKYFIIDNSSMQDIKKINFDNINMKSYNINATNTITKQVIEVERPESYKSNIIKPVFFKAQNSMNIIVHPQVSENIAIRLDAYKSKVKAFSIQIEGVVFPEVGRTNEGVVFTIVGSKLPKEINDGQYFILDSDGLMVTNGNYVYA